MRKVEDGEEDRGLYHQRNLLFGQQMTRIDVLWQIVAQVVHGTVISPFVSATLRLSPPLSAFIRLYPLVSAWLRKSESGLDAR